MGKNQADFTEEAPSSKGLIAKKDFVLHCNEIHHEIKKGDDVAKLKLDKKFITNLKTEKVI